LKNQSDENCPDFVKLTLLWFKEPRNDDFISICLLIFFLALLTQNLNFEQTLCLILYSILQLHTSFSFEFEQLPQLFDPLLFLILSHASKFSSALPHLVITSNKGNYSVLQNDRFEVEEEISDFENSTVSLIEGLSDILESSGR